MKKYNHSFICEAPICVGDPTPDWKKNVTWFPGEQVCQKTPFTKVQKRQSKINRFLEKGKLRYPDSYYTFEMLERKKLISQGIKGIVPDSRVERKIYSKSGMSHA